MFDKLDSKENEQDIYRMAKRRQEKTNEISVVKYIMDKNKIILVQGVNIKDRWRKYLDELFNRKQGNIIWTQQLFSLDQSREIMRRK